MAWPVIDRNKPVVEPKAPPVLSEAVRLRIESFFPRYETKRAALLPALHVIQDALGHVSFAAMREVADVLAIHPSEVFDTITFYSHFWTHPKGTKVVTVCRSITCEAMGGRKVLEAIKRRLGIDEHGTTPDGKYSLVTEECLALCDHSPCVLVNERVHKCVRPEDVGRILDDANNATLHVRRSDLFDAPQLNAECGVRNAE